jgi:hypothetical protein
LSAAGAGGATNLGEAQTSLSDVLDLRRQILRSENVHPERSFLSLWINEHNFDDSRFRLGDALDIVEWKNPNARLLREGWRRRRSEREGYC